jgi:hypothetical protein
MKELKGIRKCLSWVLFIVPIFLFTGMVSASEWAKTYDGSGREYASSIQQTTDGGYIVAGMSDSFGSGAFDEDLWVLRLNSVGDVIWQKIYRSDYQDDDEGARSIQQTTDGGYIVAGYLNNDALVLKLDANGNVAWQKMYYSVEVSGWANSIQQTTDGGYIVAGDSGGGAGDAWVLKLDSNGNVAWGKTYGGSSYETAGSIRQTTDGGYIVAGSTQSFGAGGKDAWVLKLDSNGNVVWGKTYGGSLSDWANSIQQTTDGGYIVAGSTQNWNTAWVLRLDGDGNILWQKGYSSSIEASSVQQTTDGGYIVAANWPFSPAILKLNTNGDVVWGKGYENAYLLSILQTSDGGCIATGYSAQPSSFENILILKLNGNGNIPCCPKITTSGGVAFDTSATVNDTTVTGTDIAFIYSIPTANQIETHATVTEICYSEGQQNSVIDKILGVKEPGGVIRIIGQNFCDTQGDSAVHIGPKVYGQGYGKIRLWTDTKIKVKLPNYKCEWFKGQDFRYRKVWVTVDGVDSNKKRIKVLKADTCP